MARFVGLVILVFTITVPPAFAQVDLSGVWGQRQHEDQQERGPGGELGDYLGIPLNDAARLRADSWDAALYGLAEWQCRPHGADVMWRSVHPLRVTKDIDPVTGETIAYHFNFDDLLDRVIYLDGRPHPPEEAAHTWAGFSTGKWEGDVLTITTTHLKEYILRRDGVPRSDLATMTEHIMRHGDFLTIFQIVKDPVYLTEPWILSTDFQFDPRANTTPELCEIEEETDHPKGWVPHRLPGTTTDAEEFAKKHNLSVDAVRGGAETMYPEYRKTLKPAAGTLGAQAAASQNARPARAAAADVRVLKIRDNVYMLSGASGNMVVQTFAQGVTVVDTGLAQNADRALAAIKQLSTRPVVHIINTNADPDHVGGNEKLAAAGRRIPADIVAGDAAGAPEGPTIVAHEEVLARMSAPTGAVAPAPVRAWPTDTYHVDYKKLSAHFHGGEAIQLFHEKAAHTDGDSLVWLRRADVLVTGDLFTTTTYPVINLAAGGSINGVISALNHILDVAFFDYRSEGGTMIVPGHGRLCDASDVAYYRDMVTIIRDRVQDAIRKGMTLQQVKAAKLSRDYDPRYGSTTGPWTTDMFIEAVYKSLGGK